MKKGIAIFPGWLFPFVYCVAGVDAYEGAVVRIRKNMHEKVILIDDTIV